jgi:hypothetical protein
VGSSPAGRATYRFNSSARRGSGGRFSVPRARFIAVLDRIAAAGTYAAVLVLVIVSVSLTEVLVKLEKLVAKRH